MGKKMDLKAGGGGHKKTTLKCRGDATGQVLQGVQRQAWRPKVSMIGEVGRKGHLERGTQIQGQEPEGDVGNQTVVADSNAEVTVPGTASGGPEAECVWQFSLARADC